MDKPSTADNMSSSEMGRLRRRADIHRGCCASSLIKHGENRRQSETIQVAAAPERKPGGKFALRLVVAVSFVHLNTSMATETTAPELAEGTKAALVSLSASGEASPTG